MTMFKNNLAQENFSGRLRKNAKPVEAKIDETALLPWTSWRSG